jgi:two-component system, cell cycle sensor histidine kinase and response regulator CckA
MFMSENTKSTVMDVDRSIDANVLNGHHLPAPPEAAALHAALAESKREAEFLRHIADACSQGQLMCELQPDQRLVVVAANRMAATILNRGMQQLYGKTIEEVCSSDSLAPLVEPVRRVAEIGKTYSRGSLHLGTDPVRDVYQVDVFQPAPRQVILVFERTTNRSNLNDELRKLLYAVEQSPASIVITDTSGSIEYVNPRFTQVSGYTFAEVVGKNPRILKSGNAPASMYRELWETITSGREWNGELLNKKKSGEIYWEYASISPIKDTAGCITHFLGTKEDITLKKRAEDALRASEDSLRVIFNSVYDAILIHELNGSLIDLNDKGLQLFGVTRERALKMSIKDDLSSSENHLEELSNYWRKAVTGENQFFEWKARRPDDGVSFNVEIFLRRIVLRGKPAILTTIRDISERKRMQSQLNQSQRLESIAAVVGSIAHEFNNTLNNVLGFSTLIRKYVQDQAKVSKYSQAIEQSVMKSADLGNRLLSFAKEAKRESAPIDLEHLIAELVDKAAKNVGTGIRIEKKIDAKILKILGDRQELAQALMNIIVNANEAIVAKQSGSGSRTILVSADNSVVSEENAPKLMLPAGSPCVVLRISDDGVGIPDAIRDRIFDPFFTTKEQKRGTGLGLSIAFAAVRSHRGTMIVESEVGRGTTLKIILPALDVSKGSGTLPFSANGNARGGELILLVDDEDAMREIGRDILEEKGYRVLTAADGLEAVDIYRKRSKEISLVILDLVMPKMDGGQTFLELKRINNSIKTIFCTGFASDAIITQLLSEEHISAIQKPFRPADFLQTVEEVLSVAAE